MKRVFYACAAWVLLVGLTGPAKAQYTFTTIDVPGIYDTQAFGINAASQIVGQYLLHGLLLDVDGSYTIFDVPGAANGTVAYGINDAGQIVGYYLDAAGTFHGFLATPGG